MLQFNIRQVVPPELCFTCDVCCRFPEKDSFLAPYFTPDEITAAAVMNPPLSPFSKGGLWGIWDKGDLAGCRITLIPYREGYICPAFDPETAHCKIYNTRPIDCKLYPFAIMWDADGKEVVLGMDTKCPYVIEQFEEMQNAECGVRNGRRGIEDEGSGIIMCAKEIVSAIESPPLLDLLAANKGLIGPYQDDVIILAALKTLTSRI